MSSTTLKNLPNEILTQVLRYLEIRDLFSFGHLSTRTRAVSRDKTLWKKVTIRNKTLKSEFLKFIVRNGCKFLKLTNVQLKGYLRLRRSSILKDLTLDRCAIENQVLEEFLGSCCSLTKLTLRGVDVSGVNTKNLKKFVLQNRKTLQTLKLRTSKTLDLESFQFIINNCNELTELNLKTLNRYDVDDVLSEESINYLANNLNEKVLKLNLGYQRFVKDDHITKLIPRFKRLEELNLNGTSISPNSLTCLIQNLKHSLVILRLCNTNLNFYELLELRAMPKLKVLNCSHLSFLPMEDLKERFPNLRRFTNYELLAAAFSAEDFDIII